MTAATGNPTADVDRPRACFASLPRSAHGRELPGDCRDRRLSMASHGWMDSPDEDVLPDAESKLMLDLRMAVSIQE